MQRREAKRVRKSEVAAGGVSRHRDAGHAEGQVKGQSEDAQEARDDADDEGEARRGEQGRGVGVMRVRMFVWTCVGVCEREREVEFENKAR